MTPSQRKHDLDALESFARALESLHRADARIDVRALAAAYGVSLGESDDDEERALTPEERKAEDERLAENHRRREALMGINRSGVSRI
jgi:hypothetical protein